MTMTTVGYGDITPKNNIERLFANLIILFSSIIFAFILNSIGLILSNLQKNQ